MATATETQYKKYEHTNGVLCVYESGKQIPFDIKRVFTVSAMSGSIRGDHAHKKCTQLLVCVAGKIRVTCDDGSNISHHLLDNMGSGLLISPGVWAKQEYLEDGAVLMVLCDRGYEEDDYIRQYSNFKKFIEL